jgi:hypothetical protein
MQPEVSGRRRTVILAGLVLLATAACAASPATSPIAPPTDADVSASPLIADCPALPITLEALIELDAERGPLAQRFDPDTTTYHERARACFADTEIEFVGFVASPEGLGGVVTFSLRPEWLAYPSFHVQPSAEILSPPNFGAGPFLSIAVEPGQGDPTAAFAGGWVHVTGHFADAAAATCRADGPAGSTPTVEEAIAICETTFVASAIEPIAAP